TIAPSDETMTASATAESLPAWDLEPLFAGLDAADYRSAMSAQTAELAELQQFFDARGIRRLAEPVSAADDAQLSATLAEALRRVSALLKRGDRLEGFLYALVTTNSYDTAAQRELSKLERLDALRQQLTVRLESWIGSIAPRLAALIA